MTRRAVLYFSLRSPYSWLAVHRLRSQVSDLAERVDLIPYWDPDRRTAGGLAERGGEFHYVQMSRAKHFYMLQDTKRMAAHHGLTMAWPVDVDPWWERPHLAWLQARRDGRQWPFYDALTAARWGRGEDICDPVVVRSAAAAAGLDPGRLLGAVDDPQVRSEGVDCLHRAYLDDIFGIPYLKWGRQRFWGLDRVDPFLQAWAAAPPATSGAVPGEVPAAVLAGTRSYDTDTAGGCG